VLTGANSPVALLDGLLKDISARTVGADFGGHDSAMESD